MLGEASKSAKKKKKAKTLQIIGFCIWDWAGAWGGGWETSILKMALGQWTALGKLCPESHKGLARVPWHSSSEPGSFGKKFGAQETKSWGWQAEQSSVIFTKQNRPPLSSLRSLQLKPALSNLSPLGPLMKALLGKFPLISLLLKTVLFWNNYMLTEMLLPAPPKKSTESLYISFTQIPLCQ